MKRYIDKDTDRYQFMVRETLNGYSIEVLIVPTGDIVGLTPQVAAQLQIALPKPYRIQGCTLEAAERQLDELAALNGWLTLK
jgi:hypothetical protein